MSALFDYKVKICYYSCLDFYFVLWYNILRLKLNYGGIHIMDKERITKCLKDEYTVRVLLSGRQSGIVLCSSKHLYFVAQNVSEVVDGLEDFIIRDLGDTGKILCAYDSETDCLAFMQTIQYRKVILSAMIDKGISGVSLAQKIITVLEMRNLHVDDDLLLDIMSFNEVCDRLFNSPLGRKPSELEAVVGVDCVEPNVFKVLRGDNSVTYYSVQRDKRTKAQRKEEVKDDGSWRQLGFICKKMDYQG